MWGEGLEMHTKPWVRARARRAYWENMKPASGRPFCPSMSCPDNWGATKGDAILVQQQEATRKEQIEEVQKIQMEKLKIRLMGKPQKARELNSCNTVNVF